MRGDVGRREAGQRGQPDRRLAGRERDPARRRDADPQAGEAAGAGGDGDTVKLGEFDLGGVHHPRDQRHHGFGVAAHHRDGLAGGDGRAAGVEHGSRAGFERGVDGKDTHGSLLRVDSRRHHPRKRMIQ